jgi:outer membrane lipoprotein-sorting protein
MPDSRWIAALLSVTLTLLAAPAWAAFDLDTLTALLAQRKSAQASFTEERFVSGLDGPLRASGTLSFSAPDHFVRQTLEPQAESMSVDGNTVTLKRGKRSRQMALDAVPELTTLIGAIRATLSGNAAALRQQFNASVEGGPALWTLTLSPLHTQLGAQVRELKIAGQGSDLRSVELWLAGGDHSLMIVTPIAASAASAASAAAAASAPR